MNEEVFELNQFKKAALESDNESAIKAIKKLAKIRNVNELIILMTLQATFSNDAKISKFINRLVATNV